MVFIGINTSCLEITINCFLTKAETKQFCIFLELRGVSKWVDLNMAGATTTRISCPRNTRQNQNQNHQSRRACVWQSDSPCGEDEPKATPPRFGGSSRSAAPPHSNLQRDVQLASHPDTQRPTLHWDATGTCHRSGGQRYFLPRLINNTGGSLSVQKKNSN